MRTRRVVSPELCPASGRMSLSSAPVVFKFWSWGWEKIHSWNAGFWEGFRGISKWCSTVKLSSSSCLMCFLTGIPQIPPASNGLGCLPSCTNTLHSSENDLTWCCEDGLYFQDHPFIHLWVHDIQSRNQAWNLVTWSLSQVMGRGDLHGSPIMLHTLHLEGTRCCVAAAWFDKRSLQLWRCPVVADE